MPSPSQLSVTERVPEGWSGDQPLVVLVHGSLDRSGSFSRVVRRLADLHTVVYDRRGYQRSREVLPLNLDLAGHVDDLLAVIDGRPAVVVGHSYGGDIALGAALRPGGPGPVVSVAAYEPPMPWLGLWPANPAPVGATTTSATDWSTIDPDDPEATAAAAERFFRRMVGDAAWDRLPEEGRAGRRADGAALAAELRAIRTGGAPFDVTTLTVPATIGRGGDSTGRHHDTADWLVDHVPGARLIEIPGAQHGAHLTHPDAFAALVRVAVARAGQRVGMTP